MWKLLTHIIELLIGVVVVDSGVLARPTLSKHKVVVNTGHRTTAIQVKNIQSKNIYLQFVHGNHGLCQKVY